MRRPKMKLDHLSTIICVAEERNLEDAAKELGLTPSAVRKQIDTLEKLLGVRVIQSGVGGLCLTEYGELLHLHGTRTIAQALLVEEKISTIQALRNDYVLMGHSTYLPPKLIALIHDIGIDNRPMLRIEHTSGTTKMITERVINGSLHIGLGILPIECPDLLIRQIFEEPIVVCLPSDHKLASRATIFPADLKGQPIVAVGRELLPALHREIENYFFEFGVRIEVAVDAFAPPEALICVEQKRGVCMLAKSSAIVRPGVTVRPLSSRALTRRSGVFIREDNSSSLIDEMVRLLVQKVSKSSWPRP
jgi:DNA-binding transcriptional LysR family regulator